MTDRKRRFDEKEFDMLLRNRLRRDWYYDEATEGALKGFIDHAIRKSVGECLDEVEEGIKYYRGLNAIDGIRSRYGLTDKPGEGKK